MQTHSSGRGLPWSKRLNQNNFQKEVIDERTCVEDNGNLRESELEENSGEFGSRWPCGSYAISATLSTRGRTLRLALEIQTIVSDLNYTHLQIRNAKKFDLLQKQQICRLVKVEYRSNIKYLHYWLGIGK